MDNFISIDFGTTACRIGYDRDGSFEFIPNRYSDGRVPLLVEHSKSTPLQKRQNEKTPLFSFSSIKQKIGFEEEVEIDSKRVRVIDLASDIFRGLREDAKTDIGETSDNAVITVPASFSEKQRAAMRAAAEKAGFTYVKLLDESTAAIWGSDIRDEGKAFIVYALGGGIFTVSIFRIINGAPQALCHEGDRRIGGQSFDSALIHHVRSILGMDGDFRDLRYASIHKLKSLAEHLKIGLSKRDSIAVDLNIADYFDKVSGNDAKNNINHVLNRTDFERIIDADIKNTLALTRKAIQGAGLTNNDIEAFILIGGSTKIPLVEKMIGDEFGKKIIRLPNEALLKGATIYGAQLPEPSMEKIRNQVEKREESKPSKEREPLSKTIPVNDREMTWLKEFSPYLINAQQLWKRGIHEEAISHLEKMYQELPKFISNLYFTRGEMFMKLDKFDQAIIYFEKGLILEKDNKLIMQAYHKACSSKGSVLAKNGNLVEARAVIKRGLEVEPGCRGCVEFLQKIEDGLRSKHYSGFNFKSGTRPRKKKR